MTCQQVSQGKKKTKKKNKKKTRGQRRGELRKGCGRTRSLSHAREPTHYARTQVPSAVPEFGPPGGYSYMDCVVMCRRIQYGFSGPWSLNRVSFFASFGNAFLAQVFYQLKSKRVSAQVKGKEMAFLKLKYKLKYQESDFYKYLCFTTRISCCLGPLNRV